MALPSAPKQIERVATEPPIHLWRKILRTGEAAAVIAFIGVAFSSSDTLVIHVMFAVAGVIAILSITTDPHTSSINKLIFCSILIAVLVLCYFFVQSRLKLPAPSESVLSQEVTTVKELNDLLGDEREMQLDDVFDIRGILENNLLFEANKLSKFTLRQDQTSQVDAFMKGSQISINLRYFRMTGQRNEIPNLQPLPGTAGGIYISKKYQDNTEKLRLISISPFLPEDLRAPTNALIHAIEDDIDLMMKVVTDYLQRYGPNILANEVDYNSKNFQIITHAYLTQIDPLAPKAAKIREACRSFLEKH